VRGPKENRFRPAVDPLFRSAAVAHGPRAVGVVLSGALDDGTAGLSAIKSCGGIAIAQDPDEASFPGMPASACQHVRVDYVETAHHIGALIAELAQQPVNLAAAPNVPDAVKFELAITEQTMNGMEANNQIGRPTVLSCPDCNGVLWEVQGSDIVRFRCHVGHSYTADAMMLSQSESLERALWAAVAALQQRAKLCEAMLAKARERDWKFSIEDLEEKAKEARDHVDVLRKVLLRGREFTAAETAAEQNADHLDDSHQEVRAGEREIVQELHRARPNRR
jgi:two-component system chemotaxis response regulator CheB